MNRFFSKGTRLKYTSNKLTFGGFTFGDHTGLQKHANDHIHPTNDDAPNLRERKLIWAFAMSRVWESPKTTKKPGGCTCCRPHRDWPKHPGD